MVLKARAILPAAVLGRHCDASELKALASTALLGPAAEAKAMATALAAHGTALPLALLQRQPRHLLESLPMPTEA